MSERSGGSIVVMGASAGGLSALSRLLADLPRDLRVPIVIVQHLAPNHRSMIAEILAARTGRRVIEATEGERPAPATVYVAPPDRHLIFDERGRFHLDEGTAVHFVRPAADRLFESVAATYGSKAVAVVLTGVGQDGSNGVRSIKAAGGRVLAQKDAEFPAMPAAAIETGCVDATVPLAALADAVAELTRGENRQ